MTYLIKMAIVVNRQVKMKCIFLPYLININHDFTQIKNIYIMKIQEKQSQFGPWDILSLIS